MMLYEITNVKVRSSDGDTGYFNIEGDVLPGDTLTPYLFIICLDYMLRTSIDTMKVYDFKLAKKSSSRVDTAIWMHYWTLTKCMDKKLDGSYTRMLRAVLNKSWREHPTKQQQYGHRPLMTKTIQVRQTKHAGTPVNPITWMSKGRTTS